MTEAVQMRWKRIETGAASAFWICSAAVALFVIAGVFGYVESSSTEYAVFILGTVVICGLTTVREVANRHRLGAGDRRLRIRLAVAVIGTLMASVSGAYIAINANALQITAPFFTSTQMAIGVVFTIGVLLLTLIHWGPVLTGIISLSIVYFFYGDLIHNVLFTHPHYSAEFVMNYIGLGTTQGFFWFAQLASSDIYFLVIYAGVLLGLGMLALFLEVGKFGGRRVAGGAAIPALFGSGVVASVMGQAVSNVMMTGRFTIPMMQKYGYGAPMAGAIEACASSAGQIMPPVLGLAAFLIASFLNMAYIHVALAAFIPAMLYMAGITLAIFVYAHRRRLPKLVTEVDVSLILRLTPTFVVSFTVVLVLLLEYYSPSIAGLAGIATALVVSLFQGKYRPTRQELRRAIEESFELVALLSLLLIAIGPLGQSMLTTNLSGRLGTIMLEILPNSLIVYLLGTMAVSLVLGMGLPTPVAYLIASLALVPFLQQLGLPPLEAQFFVFYFAVFSTLTPPVNVSVMAATKISGATIFDTSVNAIKLACTTFIIPFAFVYNPSLMSFPHASWQVIPIVAEVMLIQWLVSVANYGYFARDLGTLERFGFGLAALAGFAAMIHYGDAGMWYRYQLLFAGTLALMVVLVYARRGAGDSGDALPGSSQG